MLARAKKEGWEGLIVKDGQSLYHSGRRTPAWRKLKILQQQEFVIGGYTAPRQSRTHFGSVLVGYRKGRDLIFAGSVGTGFTQAELDKLAALFAKRRRATSPFVNRVVSNETPHFITPDLVCEVKFIEWTGDGLLRQPIYLGLRDDTRFLQLTAPVQPGNSGGPAIVGDKMIGLAFSTLGGAQNNPFGAYFWLVAVVSLHVAAFHAEALRGGQAASAAMHEFSWRRQTGRLLEMLGLSGSTAP